MRNKHDFSKEKQVRGNAEAGLLTAMESNKKYNEVGQNKGLYFKFRENEIIDFPEVKECYIINKPYLGKPVLYIPGYSLTRKRMVEIPLAIFRRIPAVESESDVLFDPEVNSLTTELAELGIDLQRARKLCEVGQIKCRQIFPGHKAVLEKDDKGNWKRVADKVEDQKFYVVEESNEVIAE